MQITFVEERRLHIAYRVYFFLLVFSFGSVWFIERNVLFQIKN